MRSFTVHHRPGERHDLIFVRDRWSWAALVFGPFWLIWHRLWWELAAFVGLSLVVGIGFSVLGAAEPVQMAAQSVLSLGLAIAGNDLRRGALERRGYREIGSVTGETLEDCEDRLIGRARGAEPAAPAAGEPA